jgi:hypothetical protein
MFLAFSSLSSSESYQRRRVQDQRHLLEVVIPIWPFGILLMQVKSTQRQEEMEHFLSMCGEEVLHPLVHMSSSLTMCFVIQERVLQQSGMLLLPRSSCGLQPLTHLLEGDCIDLTSCIPQAKYF